jgi:hypothetical protein
MRNNEEMLHWHAKLADEGRSMIVRYEELVAEPRALLSRVCDFISVPGREEVVSNMLPFVPGGTPPKKQKWREKNLSEIRRIMPVIAGMQATLGYPVSLE